MIIKKGFKKIISVLIVVFGITFLSFSLMYISPGDPAEMMLSAGGVPLTKEVVENKRVEMGLDKPFIVQYANWLEGFVRGDLGESLIYHESVNHLIISRLPATIYLAVVSLVGSLLIAIPLGVFCAVNNGKLSEKIIKLVTLIGPSTPSFFIALLLMYFICLKLSLLPVIDSGVTKIILPAITIIIGTSSKFVRQIRAIVLEELSKEYVLGLKARGVNKYEILFKHVLKNSALPIVTLIGLSLGSLMGGMTIVESVFMWQGIGKFAVDSIARRDYPVVQAYVVWMALIFLIINYGTDLLYKKIDPRIKSEGVTNN